MVSWITCSGDASDHVVKSLKQPHGGAHVEKNRVNSQYQLAGYLRELLQSQSCFQKTDI